MKLFSDEILYDQNWFRNNDWITVNRIRFTDVFNCQGRILFEYKETADATTKNVGNAVIEVNTTNPQFLIAKIMKTGLSSVFNLEYVDGKFKITSLHYDLKIAAEGSLQSLLGIFGTIEIPYMDSRFGGKNVFGIKFLKLISDDIDACAESYNQTGQNNVVKIESNTIAVIPASDIDKGFSENSTYGIHMRIKNNMKLRFRLVD